MAEASKVREEQPVASTQNEAASNSAATSSAATTEDKSKNEASSPSVVDSPKTTPEIGEALLERLARQVEYYFSSANLSKDTYVSTLRSLNDGYVPISIIANFGKVKSLVQYDAINAVRMAATEFSELLEVVEIDTQTGKRATKADDNSRSSDVPLIAAVGPISGEPIPISVIPAAPVTPPAVKSTAPIQNTVIIREVPEGTEEAHIRQLFTFDSCPSIESLHLDVANCWFVTLNTSSRDDMVNVMFELRKMKFQSGEPVLARLKSGVVLSAVSQPFIPAMFPSVQPPPTGYNNGSRKNKKKKNNNSNSNNGNNGKSRQGGNGNNQNKNGRGGKNGNPRNRNNGKQQKKSNGQTRNHSPSQEQPQTPPTLGEEHFPTLPSEEMSVNKIEVEKVPEEVERNSRPEDDSSCDDLGKPKAHSDSGSTATTTSSSSSTKLGGYAAALKKAAPPKPVEPAPKRVSEKKQSKKNKAQTESKKGEKASQNAESTVQAPVVDSVGVEPPSWGGGRTFASLLRKESKGAASEQAAV